MPYGKGTYGNKVGRPKKKKKVMSKKSEADSTSTTTSGETFVVHSNQWLTDSAKEVINMLPKRLLHLCASSQTFTSGTPNALNTGHILHVTSDVSILHNWADKYFL